MSPNRFRDAAYAAATRGWMVFPLRPGSKRPAIAAWPDQATTDRDRITRWWAHNRAYNLLTGLLGDIPCVSSRLGRRSVFLRQSLWIQEVA